ADARPVSQGPARGRPRTAAHRPRSSVPPRRREGDAHDGAKIHEALGMWPARGSPAGRPASDQLLTLSLSALAIVTFTTLSDSFLICSPVAGLRTRRSGRSRQ